MSKSSKTRSRTQLSRAAIKAYEARRAEEVNRVEGDAATIVAAPVATGSSRRGFAISRVEEFATIRSDLRRLGMILAFLTVLLLVATLVLR